MLWGGEWITEGGACRRAYRQQNLLVSAGAPPSEGSLKAKIARLAGLSPIQLIEKLI